MFYIKFCIALIYRIFCKDDLFMRHHEKRQTLNNVYAFAVPNFGFHNYSNVGKQVTDWCESANAVVDGYKKSFEEWKVVHDKIVNGTATIKELALHDYQYGTLCLDHVIKCLEVIQGVRLIYRNKLDEVIAVTEKAINTMNKS